MNPRENWEKVFYFSGKVNIRAARAQLNAKYREDSGTREDNGFAPS